MNVVYDKEKQIKPIKMWLDDIEDGAMQQAINLSNLPFLYKHVALMPDSHQGYSVPIGSVLATKDVIIPNAIGVDISCGVIATQTDIESITHDQLKEIMGKIRQRVPVGFNHHNDPQEWSMFDNPPDIKVIKDNIPSARKQLGTLGSGNHFIEFQFGAGTHWVMIHSGSRNFGYKIANHYHKIAEKLCQQWHSNITPLIGNDSLAFLPLNSQEGREYIQAMEYASKFAEANRLLMMNNIMDCIQEVIGCNILQTIHVPHNYARIEHHFGQNVVVHRKGAISARENELGIIPGSQGTKSYIVKGKGNPESFMSCSHGAGRKMSRNQARQNLVLQDEIDKLDKRGIIHGIRHQKDLDEASSAYKDIDVVMENQKDLVDIVYELTPAAVIKG